MNTFKERFRSKARQLFSIMPNSLNKSK